ncbi:hypothetical protein SFRURICE_014662 [Spodoptera frugiperda]|nr:hypothetical protein SFRURICE_014662 [Spodoptera frugiperda]
MLLKFINLAANKRVLMADGYTFAQTTPRHYYCSKKGKGCKARIFLNKDDTQIIYFNNEHNHNAPVYKLTKFKFISTGTKNNLMMIDYILIPSGQKNKLLMLDGYTFAQMHSRRHWYCSKKKTGCKARIKMDVDFVTVIEACRIHNHEPPDYYVTKAGYILIPGRYKNKLLMLNGYTFAQTGKRNWYCSKKNAGCKAKINMADDGVTIREAVNEHFHEPPSYYITKSGYTLIPGPFKNNLLMLNGYTFAQKGKRYWYCSKKKAGCKAKINMADDGVTIREVVNEHFHEPPSYYITKSGYTLIPGPYKNNLLMLNGYTFAQKRKRYWYCSKKNAGCKAKINMADDGVTIREAVNEHFHEPPSYYITKSGYILIPGRYKNKLLMLNGYTFAQTGKRNWYCSKKNAGCKAKINMAEDGVTIREAVIEHFHEPPSYYITKSDCHLITMSSGKQLVYYKGHTFSFRNPSRRHAYCSKYVLKKCPARLKLYPDGCQVITMSTGKQLVLYQGHTFSFRDASRSRAYCSKYCQVKCPARLTLHPDGSLRAATNTKDHNHPPPKLFKNSDGLFIRIQ